MYITIEKVNRCVQTMAHSHGGATTWTKVCTTLLARKLDLYSKQCFLYSMTVTNHIRHWELSTVDHTQIERPAAGCLIHLM